MENEKEKKNKTKNKKYKFIIIVLIIIIILLLLLLGIFYRNYKKVINAPTGNVDVFKIESEKDKNVILKDKYARWYSENKLRIFENPAYQLREIIAPESSNFYQFVINNNTDYDIKYSMTFVEKNIYNVNMKYRLIQNGKYLKGDANNWLFYNELNLENIDLLSEDSDTFTLEWKWIESKNDTEIGKKLNANYGLNILVKAVGEID